MWNIFWWAWNYLSSHPVLRTIVLNFYAEKYENVTGIEVCKYAFDDARPGFFWSTMHGHSNHDASKTIPPTEFTRASDSLSMKHMNKEWIPLE